jgi:hypothetical protein
VIDHLDLHFGSALELLDHPGNDVIRPSERPRCLGDLGDNLLTGRSDHAMVLGYRIKGRLYRLANLV